MSDSTRRVRRLTKAAISKATPHKTIATFSLSEKDWPPPGELEDALREASDAFVYVLRAAMDLKLKGTIIADIDYAPPNPERN